MIPAVRKLSGLLDLVWICNTSWDQEIEVAVRVHGIVDGPDHNGNIGTIVSNHQVEVGSCLELQLGEYVPANTV